MAFTLVKDTDNNLISITYEKETSFQDRVELLETLVKILSESPKMNLLIDTSQAQSNMNSDEQLEYGQLLAKNARYFRFNKTAIVNKILNPHPFILAEAYTEGFENFAEFNYLNEALAWLKGELK